MYFAVICHDRPDTGTLRGKTIPDHLRYLQQQGSRVHTGGPLKDPSTGGMVGSLYIINVDGYAEARQFIADEPLNKADLFESITVRAWMQMQPEIEPGANEATAQEFERQLRESGDPFRSSGRSD